MKKKDKALIFNIVIFILELLGFIMTIVNDKKFAIEFYTNESNILMLIGSGLYILYALRKKIFLNGYKHLNIYVLQL